MGKKNHKVFLCYSFFYLVEGHINMINNSRSIQILWLWLAWSIINLGYISKNNDKISHPISYYGTPVLSKWNKKDDDSILIIIFGDVSVSLEQNEWMKQKPKKKTIIHLAAKVREWEREKVNQKRKPWDLMPSLSSSSSLFFKGEEGKIFISHIDISYPFIFISFFLSFFSGSVWTLLLYKRKHWCHLTATQKMKKRIMMKKRN